VERIKYIYWNRDLYKTYEGLFDIQVFYKGGPCTLLGIPSHLKHSYNEKYFMVVDLKGVNRIYSISEIILGVPEELFNLFSDLKSIDFLISIIKQPVYEQDN